MAGKHQSSTRFISRSFMPPRHASREPATAHSRACTEVERERRGRGGEERERRGGEEREREMGERGKGEERVGGWAGY